MSNKKAFCISGLAGSGKSTLARTFIKYMMCPSFHSSAVFKIEFRDKNKSECDKDQDLESPEYADKKIFEHFRAFVERNSSAHQLVIETMPRKIEQISWLDELTKRDFDIVFIYVHAPADVRQKRIEARNAINKSRAEFDTARSEAGENYEKHFDIITAMSDKIGQIRLKEKPEAHGSGSSFEMFCSTNDVDAFVKNMMRIHYRTNYIPQNGTDLLSSAKIMATNIFYERGGYINLPNAERMAERIKEEINEFISVPNEIANKQEALLEFADILHFLFCLAESRNLSALEIKKAFFEKNAINQARLHFGTKENIKNGNLIIPD